MSNVYNKCLIVFTFSFLIVSNSSNSSSLNETEIFYCNAKKHLDSAQRSLDRIVKNTHTFSLGTIVFDYTEKRSNLEHKNDTCEICQNSEEICIGSEKAKKNILDKIISLNEFIHNIEKKNLVTLTRD